MTKFKRSVVGASMVVVVLALAASAYGQVVATDEGAPGNVEGSAEWVEDQTMPTSPPGRAEVPQAAAAEAAMIEKEGAAAAGLSEAQARKVEEIVISARRRSELLEETPISVTVLSDAALQATGTTQINELQNLVPNLSIFRTGSGQTVSIVTRGVGNFPFVYYDQGTPLYVDGVVLSRNAGSVLDIVDISQIEVLRGPQGTLFGKNSVGGAVSITTVKPQPEMQGYASIRAGGLGTFDSRAMINVPVIEDQLFVRVNFASFARNGYYTNTITGEKLSDRNSQNVLVAGRWLPIPDLTIDLTGSYSVSHTQGLGPECVVIEPAFTDATTTPYGDGEGSIGVTGEQYRERCMRSKRYEGESDVARMNSVQSYGIWSIADYQIGDLGLIEDVGVKFTGAWRQQVVGNRDDLDGTLQPAATISTAGGGGEFDGTPNWQNQLQSEVQVSGTAWDDRINFVGGAFLFWERARTNNGFRFFEDTDSSVALFVRQLALSQNFVSIDNNDWALFGQATADFTEWLSLTAGIRYTEETKRLERLLLQPATVPGFGDPTAVDFSGELKSDAWTPMASLALTLPQEWAGGLPLDHLMGYFTFARGFRGGGFNGGARTERPEALDPFQPEFGNSFEIGGKTILFEGRLLFNVSAYLLDREDQQVPQIFSFTDPFLGIPRTDVLTRNAAESTSKGVEVELLAQPIENMRVDATMGYLNGVFGDFPGGQNARTGAPLDRSGQEYTFVPRWQTHLGVQYSIELPEMGASWLNGWVTPRVDWSFQSETQYWVPELPELLEPNRNLVNMRITYDFNDNQSQFAFWGTNMTDHEYYQESVAIPRTTGVITRYWALGRVMGVEFSHTF